MLDTTSSKDLWAAGHYPKLHYSDQREFERRLQTRRDAQTSANAPVRNPTPKRAHMDFDCPLYPLGPPCDGPLSDRHGLTLDNVTALADTPVGHRVVGIIAHHVAEHALTDAPTGEHTVGFVFEPDQFSNTTTPRVPPLRSEDAEPQVKFSLPAEQALIVMAGAHDKPKLFEELLKRSADDDMILEVVETLRRAAFISPACLDRVVHLAADHAMTLFKEHEEVPDGGTDHTLIRAQRVVCAYLVGLTENEMEREAKAVFETIIGVLPRDPTDEVSRRELSAYSGIITGLCLAGLLNFFCLEIDAEPKNVRRLKYSLDAVAAGLSFIPMVGPDLGPVANGTLADLVVERVAASQEPPDQFTNLCEIITVAAFAREIPQFDPEEFSIQLLNTMYYCFWT